MLCSRGMPKKITAQLEEFLIKTGFVNQTLKITPLPLNHEGNLCESGKLGRLLW
jgi:hypothetical protein